MFREDYLESFNVEGDIKRSIRIQLKFQGRKGIISGLQRISKPGLRHYTSAKDIPLVLGGMGIAVVSTPQVEAQRPPGTERLESRARERVTAKTANLLPRLKHGFLKKGQLARGPSGVKFFEPFFILTGWCV